MNIRLGFFYRISILFLTVISLYGQPSRIQNPSQFLGFEVGSDNKLADYNQITSYFQMLAKTSPRIEVENLGKTTLGNNMFMAVISSEENLRRKSEYQQIARKLADPRGLSEAEIEDLAIRGKVIALVTCNIHASEIGATQMAMEWAYSLATAEDPETKRRLDNVILLLVPSLNPDGQLMEVEWYRKYIGTKYEGVGMPWLYLHYIGHDNNRDWFMLTQKETKAMNNAAYHKWYPQVSPDCFMAKARTARRCDGSSSRRPPQPSSSRALRPARRTRSLVKRSLRVSFCARLAIFCSSRASRRRFSAAWRRSPPVTAPMSRRSRIGGLALSPAVLGAGLAALLLSGGLLVWLWKDLGEFRIPVICYAVVISAMMIASLAHWVAAPTQQSALLVLAAYGFALSDVSVARDQFRKREFANRVWGLPLYFGAQCLFALNV